MCLVICFFPFPLQSNKLRIYRNFQHKIYFLECKPVVTSLYINRLENLCIVNLLNFIKFLIISYSFIKTD